MRFAGEAVINFQNRRKLQIMKRILGVERMRI